MGWDFSHREPGVSVHDYLARDFKNLTILDSAIVNRTFYAACEEIGKPGHIFALVALLKMPRDYYNFGYKAMGETEGPFVNDCPARILDKLTPVVGDGPGAESARQWRERCRAKVTKRQAATKVKAGDIVTFAEPLKFGNGETLTTFRFDSGSRFRAEGRAMVYRITNWRQRAYTVQAAC